ncbi:MAG: acyl-CoA dehydrogenase family protein [Deltaproteobacteria bacterium]|nr:acyl-CoA dehydrogenase family protein [Deltaproteobacteria bacterium]
MFHQMTASQLALQSKVRAFTQKWIEPEAQEMDAKGVFPWDTFRKMGKEGFLGLTIPAAYGGGGEGAQEYAILCEEVGRASAAYIHNGHYQTAVMLARYGTPEQKSFFLPKMAAGEWLAATAVSEPEVGSSFKQMRSRAQKEGNRYILEGRKIHINDAAEAGVINFFTRSAVGFTVFLVDPKEKGLEITAKMDPIGLRASPIYEFVLKDHSLSENRRLGEEGQGLEIFISTFNFSRIGNASCLLGMARSALEKAIAYAQTRKVGDKTVLEFQGNRWALAELATRLEAAALLRDQAAWIEDQGKGSGLESSMAKLLSAQIAEEIVGRMIQMTGSYGCYRDAPFERYFRDAKSLGIAGGTLEVMRNNIAAQLLK